MRVFLAGATGVIGRRLLPLLLAEGHEVVAMTRQDQSAKSLRRQGVEAVVVDVFDTEKLCTAVKAARPEAIIHQLTCLPQRLNPRRIGREMAANDRIRSVGTKNL